LILWRIGNHADLTGAGGVLHHGRWHHRGRPVVCLAESAAGALLEALVHLEAATPAALPNSHKLLEVQVPDSTSGIEAVPPREADRRQDLLLTRRIGDRWLASGASLLLRVPSAVAGRTFNRLLDPQHREAAGGVDRLGGGVAVRPAVVPVAQQAVPGRRSQRVSMLRSRRRRAPKPASHPPSRPRCRAICAHTCCGAVPPVTLREAIDPRSVSTPATSSPIAG
jgi:RES domain-containing protein